MGDVLKFTPPEASQERQELSNEVVDLLNEESRIDEELEGLNKAYLAELPQLNDKIEAARARAGYAEKSDEQLEYLGMMVAAVKELRALEKPIEDLLERKAMLAYKLEQVRQRQEELGRPFAEVKTAVDKMGDKWVEAGEKMTKRAEQLAALKEEAIAKLEQDFFTRGERMAA